MLAWGLPSFTLVAAVFMAPSTRTFVWAGALAWMGLACVANALRCGRLHCYLTGPFFLFMALASLLHGLGILWLGPRGWLWLGLAVAMVSALGGSQEQRATAPIEQHIPANPEIVLRADMEDPGIEAAIQANLKLASRLRITGTPTFVIGEAIIPGAASLEELREAVSRARTKSTGS